MSAFWSVCFFPYHLLSSSLSVHLSYSLLLFSPFPLIVHGIEKLYFTLFVLFHLGLWCFDLKDYKGPLIYSFHLTDIAALQLNIRRTGTRAQVFWLPESSVFFPQFSIASCFIFLISSSVFPVLNFKSKEVEHFLFVLYEQNSVM